MIERVSHGNELVMYWPDHPLASASHQVSLRKLSIWQERHYDPDFVGAIRTAGGGATDPSVWFGGPGQAQIREDSGYVSYNWPGHPLTDQQKTRPTVWEHQLVYWQECGYSKGVARMLSNRKASIHHKNGKRGDNRIENLELRLVGNHPKGVGEKDMADTLRLLGYKVEEPKWKARKTG